MKIYTSKEASELLKVTDRTIRTYCQTWQVPKLKKSYQITENHLKEWSAYINETPPEPANNKVKELEAIIENLKAELKEFEIKDNEVLEVFSKDEYAVFEQRLKEWQHLQKELEMKEVYFREKLQDKNELLEHYKNQFEYQKRQSDKILEMHQKLIDTINQQTKLSIQRNVIEAKEKNIINDEWNTKE
jgi:huntingtin-interacting protein 1-related protein